MGREGFLSILKVLGSMSRTENKWRKEGKKERKDRINCDTCYNLMNLEDITLSEKSWRQRGKYCGIPLLSGAVKFTSRK